MAVAFSATDAVGSVTDEGEAAAVTDGAVLVGGGGGGGGGGSAATTIVTSACDDNSPSLTVTRNTNVPAWLTVAVVFATAALSNAIPSGPLTRDQAYDSDPDGLPSSTAEAASVTVPSGNVSAEGVAVAVTTGAWFVGAGAGLIVTVTVSAAERSPSDAENCSTYTPAAPNVAVVDTCDGLANSTTPGPDTRDHAYVSTLPTGLPSSAAVANSVSWFCGRVSDVSAPASTVGAALGAGLTVIVTTSLDVASPSLAES